MLSSAVIAGLLVLLTGIFLAWRTVHLRELGRRRIEEPEGAEEIEDAPRARPFLRHYGWVPWLAGSALFAGLYFLAGLNALFSATFSLILALLGTQFEAMRVGRITFRIEQQLADAIDLMVATLQAGGGALSALDSATLESRRPLRAQLDEVLGRIRYGDDPQQVLRSLAERVPLETFRLFVSALSVHWETGGSLAPTLATVGRVIRDRIEISRRVRALTTQARASVAAVLLVTYFIALVIWRNDPERMRQFLLTTVGQALVAGCLVMQALGIVWTAALSRLRY